MSVLRDLLLIVFSLLIPVAMGVTGIFWAASIADVLPIIVTAAVMVRVWKELGQERKAQELVAAQEKAIRHIADAGSCVIIGRSADYVLRNYPDVVRIFIYAPESYREKKVMEIYGDSPETAKKSIAKSDAARGAYYKSVSGKEWGDPHGYELCVDASVGEEAAAELICSYIGLRGRQ